MRNPFEKGAYWNTRTAPIMPSRPRRNRERAGFVPRSIARRGPWYDIYTTNARRALRADPWGMQPEDWGRYSPRPGSPTSGPAMRSNPFLPGSYWNTRTGMPPRPTRPIPADTTQVRPWWRNADGRGEPRNVENAHPGILPPVPFFTSKTARDIENTRPHGFIEYRSPRNMMNTRPTGAVDDTLYASGREVVRDVANTAPATGEPSFFWKTPPRSEATFTDEKEYVAPSSRFDGEVEDNMYAAGNPFEEGAYWNTGVAPSTPVRPIREPKDVKRRPPWVTGCTPLDVRNPGLGNWCPDDKGPENRMNASPHMIWEGSGPENRLNASPHMEWEGDGVDRFDGVKDEDGACPEGMYFCPIDGICKHEEGSFDQNLWFNE